MHTQHAKKKHYIIDSLLKLKHWTEALDIPATTEVESNYYPYRAPLGAWALPVPHIGTRRT